MPGQINSGVGTPKETLKVMHRPLEEEAERADRVIMVPLIQPQNSRVGSSWTIGRKNGNGTSYDSYICNGLYHTVIPVELGAILKRHI
jgi:hypothetical protein